MNYELRKEKANKKLLKNISYGATTSLFYWSAILEHFPVTKKGKINLILRTDDKSILMGIAVAHLKSIAAIVQIPNTFIDIINQYRREANRHLLTWGKDSIPAKKLSNKVIHHTYLLLKATYHKVLQTGEE